MKQKTALMWVLRGFYLQIGFTLSAAVYELTKLAANILFY
ncbi:hypothetical protein PARC_a1539 [Pseudoalteromonas arctica A 37-1-2]|uniref:Uncharacterized protein n=1 Tax=Pseudoalteromonas arctica A 37-1-2 TaxID=1117313 RepID=A0A290S1Z3_9GAMM|nr:hypothetical protein PARC_a1539 [Pseudoalteromonas arctica A 37-1-2]